MNAKVIGGIIGGILIGVVGYYLVTNVSIGIRAEGPGTATEEVATTTKTQPTKVADPTPIADVGYACDAQKTVHAVYFSNKVIIELSDGRAMQLPQVSAASGATYSNTNGSVVFSSKGPTAFVEEDGKITYDKCLELDTAGVEGM